MWLICLLPIYIPACHNVCCIDLWFLFVEPKIGWASQVFEVVGFGDEVFHFIDQVEAGKFIQERLKQGDLVVVKGSKEHKLETIIKELMAFPLKAKEDLLVR